MRLTALVVATSLAAAAVLGAQQQSQSQGGLILGRVIEAGSGLPIRGAIVRISGREEGRQFAAVITDSEGQFVFSGLPAGPYNLWASRTGHADGSYGQRRPDEPRDELLTLKENERRGDVTLRVWRHGAISGTVVDDRGEPVVGLALRAYRRDFVGGRPHLGTSTGQATTDDRGEYRIPRLIAGEYVVAIPNDSRTAPAALIESFENLRRGGGNRQEVMAIAGVMADAGVSMGPAGDPSVRRIGRSLYGGSQPAISSSSGLFVYPTQFYAGSMAAASARAIDVRAGQDVTGIDFAVKPVRTVQISGQLIDERGPVAKMAIRLLSPNTTSFEREMTAPANVTITGEDGRFTFAGIAPGSYLLSVLKGPGGEVGFAGAMGVATSSEGVTLIRGGSFEELPTPKRPSTYFASSPIVVGNEDVGDVTVTIRTGARLSGQVEFAGTREPPPAEQLRRFHPIVETRDGHVPGWMFEMIGTVAPDRRFDTVELPPGSYFLRAPTPPEGWTLESVMLDGRDISDVPLEITGQPRSGIVMRFVDKPTVVRGTVRPGAPDDRLEDAIVVAFPVDRTAWTDFGNTPRRLQSAVVSRDGAFSLEGLPAGEYLVTAVRDDFVTEWRAPTLLEALSRAATRVSLSAGGQQNLSLVMRAGR